MDRKPLSEQELQERRRRARRSALWIALIAIAVYIGFIVINLPSR
jgi:uncharacterized membrane protein (DUF485 family)